MSEIQQLEQYLLKDLAAEDRLLMEAQLLINKDLRENLYWQQQTYALINHFGRKNLKAEIEAAHKKVFSEKKFESFRKKISSIFKTNL